MRPAKSVAVGQSISACLLIALAACGGGGGTSGGGATPPPPPSLPQPEDPPPGAILPPLRLSADNAAAAAATALRALEEAVAAAEMASFVADFQGRTGTATGICVGFSSGNLLFEDMDGNGSLSVGDVLTTNYFTCGGFVGRLRLTVSLANLAAERLDGTVEFRTEHPNGTAVEGRFALVSTYGVHRDARKQTLTEISLAFMSGDGSGATSGAQRVLDAWLDRAHSTGGYYTLSFAGRAESEPLGGEFLFETAAALSGALRAVPAEGELVLTGGGTSARFTPTAEEERRDDTLDVEIDAEGSGQYAGGVQAGWARLTTGMLFMGWQANTRPRITSLAIEPSNPTTLDDLVAVFTAIDLDGDALQHSLRWRHNGVELNGFHEVLPAETFRKGDTVELTLQVDDTRSLDRQTISVTIANAAPIEVSAQISPTSPRSDENIAIGWTAADPDGDPLTASYEWLLNGVTIAGEAGTVLPRAAYRKGDVVTGIVRVTDGETTTVGQASVTIQNTPAYVTVPLSPVAVHHGELLSFRAEAEDYDGDSVSDLGFVLAYGPTGMTVDTTTGVVSWLAGGPMFTSAVTVSYGVTVDEPGARVASGTFTLTDLDRGAPIMRTGFHLPQFGGLEIGDFDNDGHLEVLVTSERGVYELKQAPDGEYRQTWAYMLGFGSAIGPSAATTADVDGDGIHEIFIAAGDTIVQLDGGRRRATRSVRLDIDEHATCTDVEVGDLDGDGTLELVCLVRDPRFGDSQPTDGLIVLDAETLTVLKQYPSARYGFAVALGNVDDDPALEIVTDGGYVFDGNAVVGGGFESQWVFSGGFGWQVDVGDLDGDGIAEIVSGANDGQGVRAFDARTQSLRWTIPLSRALALRVTDVTGDDRAEVLVADGDHGRITVYREDPEGVTASALFSLDAQDFWAAIALDAGDLDGDDLPELIWSPSHLGNAFVIADTAGSVKWSAAEDPAPIGPFIGGELARSGNEPPVLLFASLWSHFGGLRLVTMDAATGDLAYTEDLGINGEGVAAVTIADYDGDGVDDAFLASWFSDSADYAWYMAYDFRAGQTAWQSPSLLGERGPAAIARGDLNDDGLPELVVMTREGVLRVFDVAAGTLMWQSSAPVVGSGVGVDVMLADLDGDGTLEMVAAGHDRITLYTQLPDLSFGQTAQSDLFPGLRGVAVGDVDGDGATHIFVLYGQSDEAMEVQRLDASLEPHGGFHLAWPANGLKIERSPFSRKNLVVSKHGLNSELVIVDPSAGVEIWRSPRLLGQVARRGVHFVDIAGNGELRLSVATSAGMLLTQ